MKLKSIAIAATALIAAGCTSLQASEPSSSCAKKDAQTKDMGCAKKDGSCSKKDTACAKKDMACSKKEIMDNK